MGYVVSAVRLMRIELGGAFADLLNDQGKGSGDNEMGYVERTLGFRTRNLDDRDLRLVCLLTSPRAFSNQISKFMNVILRASGYLDCLKVKF